MAMKMPAKRNELLRGIALFGDCSDRELAKIDGLVDEIEVGPGELLTREGAQGRESFVVVAGEAEVSIGGRVVGRLGPGAFFGEMAMLDLRPRVATVKAMTAMRLLVIGPASFTTFLEQPGVAIRALKGVVQRLRDAESSG